jgi:hypothetical protein
MSLPSTPTTCAAVTAALTEESGRFGPEIYSKSAWKSPIIRLQGSTRGAWTDGMGDVHNHLTYQRSFPTSVTSSSWTNISPSDGDAANACIPPIVNVGFAQKTRTSRLRHVAVETPYFCIEDIRNRFQFRDQLSKHVNALTDVSWWVWAERQTADYVDVCEHNITINQTSGIVDNGGSGYSVAAPANAQLEQGHLEDIALVVLREGGDMAPSVDVDTGAPLIELIIGKETSDNLFRNNPELLTSLRYAEMGAGMDASFLPNGFPKKRKAFGSFTHNINLYPRRFNIVGGAYVQVPTWAANAVTIGNASDLNPNWKTAEFEETILWMPNVYKEKVPAPLGEVSPGWKFNPTSYMGNFEAVNIRERVCNPDGTMIFWRAKFASAAEPIKPEVGVSILHARCGYNNRSVRCNYDTVYA